MSSVLAQLQPELAEELKQSAKARKKRERRIRIKLRATFGSIMRCMHWQRNAQQHKREQERAAAPHWGAFA